MCSVGANLGILWSPSGSLARCPFSDGFLILELKSPIEPKVSHGFGLPGDLPCGCRAVPRAGLSPAWPLASVCLPSGAGLPAVLAAGSRGPGGHPSPASPPKFTKLSCGGAEATVWVAGGWGGS